MNCMIYLPGALIDLFGNIATGNSFCEVFTTKNGCIGFQIKPASFPSQQTTLSLAPSASPTKKPSNTPSQEPTLIPSFYPTKRISSAPSRRHTIHQLPAISLSKKSSSPSHQPTLSSDPSVSPTNNPFSSPSHQPTVSSDPSVSPTNNPLSSPSHQPTLSSDPSVFPTNSPFSTPSYQPTVSSDPSFTPSNSPFSTPSQQPTLSAIPSALPSTLSPSQQPSSQVPTVSPTIKIHDGNYISPGYFNYNPDDQMFGPGDPNRYGYHSNPWTRIVDPPNKQYWAPFRDKLNTNLNVNFCGNNQNQSPVDLCPHKAAAVCMEAHQIRSKVSERFGISRMTIHNIRYKFLTN